MPVSDGLKIVVQLRPAVGDLQEDGLQLSVDRELRGSAL